MLSANLVTGVISSCVEPHRRECPYQGRDPVDHGPAEQEIQGVDGVAIMVPAVVRDYRGYEVQGCADDPRGAKVLPSSCSWRVIV